MNSSPQVQLKRTEAIKLFHLVQQYNPEATQILQAGNLNKIVGKWSEGQTFSAALLNGLNPEGRELTQSHFGNCIARFFTDSVSSISDLVNFNKKILDYLLDKPVNKNPFFYSMLKQQFQPPVSMDLDTLILYKEQVASYHEDIRDILQATVEREVIKKLNHILSSIYYSYDLFAQIAFKELCKYIKLGFVDRILNDLMNSMIQEDYYKCLLFLSEACKFQAVKNQLMKTTFFHEDHWGKHLTNYYKFSNSSLDMILIKSSIEAFLVNFIELCPEFGDYLIRWLAASPEQGSALLFPSFLNTQQPLFVKYNIQIYMQLLKRSEQNKTKGNACLINQNIMAIEKFAVKVITTGTGFTVEPSIRLISQTVKYYLGDYYSERNISFILKALEVDPPQIEITKAVLLVFENSFKYGNSDIFWIFVRNKKCIQFLKYQLMMPMEQKNTFHCQCLELFYHMAQPELISFFQENQFFQVMLQICGRNQLLLTFISKIILRAIESYVIKQLTGQLNVSIIFQTIIVLLSSASRREDMLMSSFLNGDEFAYINKQIYVNCFKSLYLLLRSFSKDKRIAEEDKEGVISLSILQEILSFTGMINISQFALKMFREEVKFSQKVCQFKLLKIIFLVVEEFIRVHKSKRVELLRNLFAYRNKILVGFYSVLPMHEVEAHGLPLLVEFNIQYLSEWDFTRLLPLTITLQALKSYAVEVLSEKFRTPMDNIIFVDSRGQTTISNEGQFKALMRNSIKSNQKQYQMKLRVIRNQPIQAQNPYNTLINRYGNTEVLGQTRISPFHGYQSERMDRSKSPISRSNRFPQTTSPLRDVKVCELCQRVPCTVNRICQSCNRRL